MSIWGRAVEIPGDPVPPVNPYLTFQSQNEFTLATKDTQKHWAPGTLEFSTDTANWTVWTGTAISSNGGKLYIRGIGNTDISRWDGFGNTSWVLSGSEIYCYGNIETLLDYGAVSRGEHPGPGVYASLFANCTNLVTPPELPAITLAEDCYLGMFEGCTGLTTAPALPATTLAEECYRGMFAGCTSLTAAPALPATTLEQGCYSRMFYGCTNLTTPPAILPATLLKDNCYDSMFLNCTRLITAPVISAMTLANSCCYEMFSNCTSLTAAPALPATTLAAACYYQMFSSCTSLTTAPALPATTLASECYKRMFNMCTGLTTAPQLPATTLEEECYYKMFSGCTNLKIVYAYSQSSTYRFPFRIPTSGTGTNASSALIDMLLTTGGNNVGTPTINTTYYTDHEPVTAN